MEISPVFLQQFYRETERILHMRGNFTGKILEMTVVLDHSLLTGQIRQCLPALLGSLKAKDEVFRNVRFNLVDWLGDERPKNRVLPMLTVMSDSFWDAYEECSREKKTELLYQYLKFYHARAKLIVLLTDGSSRSGDEAAQRAALAPFLGKKLIQIRITDKGMELV